MGLKPERRGCYTLKTYGPNLYTWCPENNLNKNKPIGFGQNKICTATPGSQGEDWNCTYVYTLGVNGGVQQRLAYVECDYVQ